MAKYFDFEPKEALADVEVGGLFLRDDDDKLYVLVYRDIIKCTVRRWTWWDEFKLCFRGDK